MVCECNSTSPARCSEPEADICAECTLDIALEPWHEGGCIGGDLVAIGVVTSAMADLYLPLKTCSGTRLTPVGAASAKWPLEAFAAALRMRSGIDCLPALTRAPVGFPKA